jgi:hypothetical protein
MHNVRHTLKTPMVSFVAPFLMILLAVQSASETAIPTTGAIIAHQKTYWLEPREVAPDVLHYVVMVDRESQADDLPGYILVEYTVCYRDTGAPPTPDYQRVVDRVEPPVSKTTHTKLRMRLVRTLDCDCPPEAESSQPNHCGNVFRFADDVMPIATRHLSCYSLACDDFEIVAEE